jgi:hypothetical protein
MVREGASSPPSVVPEPRKCELGRSSSPPGRGAFLLLLALVLPILAVVNLLSRALQNVVDLVARVGCIWVLHSQA